MEYHPACGVRAKGRSAAQNIRSRNPKGSKKCLYAAGNDGQAGLTRQLRASTLMRSLSQVSMREVIYHREVSGFGRLVPSLFFRIFFPKIVCR